MIGFGCKLTHLTTHRRVHFLDGNFTTAPRAMAYAQFVDAAALTGLYMYSFPTPKLPFASRASALITPEQQLDAFFVHLCGMKQPPRMGHGMASGAVAGQPGGDAVHMAKGQPCKDPYKVRALSVVSCRLCVILWCLCSWSFAWVTHEAHAPALLEFPTYRDLVSQHDRSVFCMSVPSRT